MQTSQKLIFYAASLAMALACVWAIRIGLRPPLVVWDPVAHLGSLIAAFIVAIAACAGIGSHLKINRLPRRLRSAPVSCLIFIVMFVIDGLLDLTAQSPPSRVIQVIGGRLLIGLTVGLMVAFLQASSSESENDSSEPAVSPWKMIICIAAIAVVALVIPRERIEARSQQIEKIVAGDTSVSIAVASVVGFQNCLLQIADGGATQAAAFDRDTWRRFADLVYLAESSPSADWRKIGQIADGSGPPTLAEVFAAQGVGLRLTTPEIQDVFVSISPADFGKLNAAMDRAEATLRGR